MESLCFQLPDIRATHIPLAMSGRIRLIRSLTRFSNDPFLSVAGQVRSMSSLSIAKPSQLPRTYQNALHLLSLLPTNRDVTTLFAAAPADDLNAAAIPEMMEWLRRAGYSPQDLARLRCIHVAGTKGKGSVCAFLTSILTRLGSVEGTTNGPGRIGTYMSPHVVTVRERILLDGSPITQELFAKYVFEVWERLTASARALGGAEPAGGFEGPATKPFYFRFLTLLAFHVFLREGIRSAVVECGIGGEYDATNVLPAEAVTAAVVGRLGLDHVAMLGDTVEKIAWHKAGVFKPGVAALAVRGGGLSDGVERVIRERASEKGAELEWVEQEDIDAWEGVPGAALRGGFQKYNMALAVAAARRHMRFLGRPDDDDGSLSRLADLSPSIVDALKTTRLRGRWETVDEEDVEWLVDGAHTSDSLSSVAELFMSNPAHSRRELRLLLFNQQERDVKPLIDAIRTGASRGGGRFNYALFVRNDREAPEGTDTTVQEEAKREFEKGEPEAGASVCADVTSAVEQVREIARERKVP